jgi:predicted dehydrogenase
MKQGLTRRNFITAGAAASTWLAFSHNALANLAKPHPDDLNIALIGCGIQGKDFLMEACLKLNALNANRKLPGVRFRAVCDLRPFKVRHAAGSLAKRNHTVNAYTDYRELLDKEKDLHAVIVATPDWMHAPISCAALEAGKHVYCEKLMSNTVEGARQMVLAQRKTKKLLQIGHQRRSNPRYLHAKHKLLDELHLLGRITHASAQWHNQKKSEITCAPSVAVDAPTLQKFGYDSMRHLLNWRWYKKYGGGPICDLGAHQIDVFNWFLGTMPSSIIATGGMDYYKEHDWYDNVIATYEYRTPNGIVRAMYDVLTTTSSLGYLEKFMGDEGTLTISETPRWNLLGRERLITPDDAWKQWNEKGIIKERKDPPAAPVQFLDDDAADKDAVPTVSVSQQEPWEFVTDQYKAMHIPHLANFFDAIRHGTALNCPPDIAYRTAVAVLKANEAVAARKEITFKPEEFEV